jgi:hypothetical protein
MTHLADLAKHLVKPDGAVSTGWPKVRDTCRNLGWLFDDWQDDLGRLILSKDRSGMYACSICAMSLCRQVGKTYLVGSIAFALCLTQPGTTVIWTAHRGRTATETFRAMKAKAKTPELAPFIDQRAKGGGIRSSNGEQEIEFLNGSRILFGAREAGFGVGFADVGMLVLDEVQRATVKAMDDLLPTTNAAVNPLVICMGTPPRPTDDGEVFTMLRTDAISGDSSDVLYVELGASARFDLNDDAEFWRQLRQVNPSFPHRVGERAILRNRKGLTEDSVFREVFGLWDDDGTGRVFGPGRWEHCRGPAPAEVRLSALAVELEADLSKASIVGAGMAAGRAYVRPLQSGSGDDWIAGRLKDLQRASGALVLIDSTGPAAGLVKKLKAAGVRHRLLKAAEVRDAFDGFFRLVSDEILLHEGFSELDAAVKGAVSVTVGDRRKWGRWKSTADISPLGAATLAGWWVSRPAPKVTPPQHPSLADRSTSRHELQTIEF